MNTLCVNPYQRYYRTRGCAYRDTCPIRTQCPYCPHQFEKNNYMNMGPEMYGNPNMGMHTDPNMGMYNDSNMGMHTDPNMGMYNDLNMGMNADPNIAMYSDSNMGINADPNMTMYNNPNMGMCANPNMGMYPIDPAFAQMNSMYDNLPSAVNMCPVQIPSKYDKDMNGYNKYGYINPKENINSPWENNRMYLE